MTTAEQIIGLVLGFSVVLGLVSTVFFRGIDSLGDRIRGLQEGPMTLVDKCPEETRAWMRRWAKRLRRHAHASFDRLWSGPDRSMSRGQSYHWLAGQMGIPEPQAHFSQMWCPWRLLQAIKICDDKLHKKAIESDYEEELDTYVEDLL